MSEKGINVLSLFDGISCGQISLEREQIKVDRYFASEIDKYAIQITQKNYPDTIQLGDIRDIKGCELPKIDLLMGGPPCQGFSFSGKQLNFEDPRSKLFFEFVRLLRECNPTYFLMKNVPMKKECEKIISKELGVFPICINSSCLSAQNRLRLYWTNIPDIHQPNDKHIYLKDIWIGGIDITQQYLNKKINTLSYKKSRSSVRTLNDKSKCLTARGQNIANSGVTNIKIDDNYYKLTPTECEKLQTLPVGYTDKGISNSQRYRCIGNAWTVDVIAHILSFMKPENQNNKRTIQQFLRSR